MEAPPYGSHHRPARKPGGMRVKLVRDQFHHWIIVPAVADATGLAWSGSRWVPIGGAVQISNFETAFQAVSYAVGAGFDVVEIEPAKH